MSKSAIFLNILYAIIDGLMCALGVVVFYQVSVHFEKWWIVLFAIIPLCFYQHTSVIDITTVKKEEANK